MRPNELLFKSINVQKTNVNEVHICTVKSQAGNTWVKGVMATQKAKATR